MKKFSESFSRIEDVLMLCSVGAIVVLMMLTIVDVLGRYLFCNPVVGSVEVSELLMVVIIVLAIAGTQRVGANIGMDALLNKFKKMNRPLFPIFQTFALLLTEAAFVMALYYSFIAFLRALDANETTAGPVYIIAWPVRGILCLGLLFMCIRLAIQLVQTVPSIRTWSSAK